jgi:hypothetical protein
MAARAKVNARGVGFPVPAADVRREFEDERWAEAPLRRSRSAQTTTVLARGPPRGGGAVRGGRRSRHALRTARGDTGGSRATRAGAPAWSGREEAPRAGRYSGRYPVGHLRWPSPPASPGPAGPRAASQPSSAGRKPHAGVMAGGGVGRVAAVPPASGRRPGQMLHSSLGKVARGSGTCRRDCVAWAAAPARRPTCGRSRFAGS